jgi:membrane associated rhomboid family serine protease
MIPLRDNVPSRGIPYVNYALIGANVLAFLFELSLGHNLQSFIQVFGLVPHRVITIATQYPSMLLWAALTFLTSIFLHGGWLHLLGNMLFLYIFGDNVEGAFGHVRYLVFYLVCGLAASLTQLVLNPSSAAPTIGASGAIAGVLGAYFLLFPNARIVTVLLIFFFIQIVEIPAFILLGFWFLLQFLSGSAQLFTSHASAGIAWWAHIGGFIAGGGYTFLRYRRIRRRRERGG